MPVKWPHGPRHEPQAPGAEFPAGQPPFPRRVTVGPTLRVSERTHAQPDWEDVEVVKLRGLHLVAAWLTVAGAAVWAAAPDLVGADGAVALVLGPVAAGLLEAGGLVRRRYLQRRHVRSTLTAIYSDVGRLDPVAGVGLRRSALAARELRSEDRAAKVLPDYVPGPIDADLDGALSEREFVLVTGNALAGKSRAAWEAVSRLRPSPLLLVPDGPAELSALLRLDPPLLDTWRVVLVWLGDLGRYASSQADPFGREDAPFVEGDAERGLSAALLRRHLDARRSHFLRRRMRLVFLATMSQRDHDQALKGNRALASGGSTEGFTRVVESAGAPVYLADGPGAGWDMPSARRLYPNVDFGLGIGRTFAEAERMIDAYRHGSNRVGCALARAAVDWRRIGAGDPTRGDLDELLAAELPGQVPTSEDLERGLAWATREVTGDQRLLTSIATGDHARYRAHGALIDSDEDYGVDGEIRAVPRGVYDVALRRLRPSGLLGVGTDAASRRRLDVAQRLLDAIIERLVEQDDVETLAGAYNQRGDLRFGRDQVGEAEADYTAAIDLEGARPDTRASAYLYRGVLRHEDGRAEKTGSDLTAAIDLEGAKPDTRASAYLNRGVLRAGAGRTQEADSDYTVAIDLEGAESTTRARSYNLRGILWAEETATLTSPRRTTPRLSSWKAPSRPPAPGPTTAERSCGPETAGGCGPWPTIRRPSSMRAPSRPSAPEPSTTGGTCGGGRRRPRRTTRPQSTWGPPPQTTPAATRPQSPAGAGRAAPKPGAHPGRDRAVPKDRR